MDWAISQPSKYSPKISRLFWKWSCASSYSLIVLNSPSAVQEVKDRVRQAKQEAENHLSNEHINQLEVRTSMLSVEDVATRLIGPTKQISSLNAWYSHENNGSFSPDEHNWNAPSVTWEIFDKLVARLIFKSANWLFVNPTLRYMAKSQQSISKHS